MCTLNVIARANLFCFAVLTFIVTVCVVSFLLNVIKLMSTPRNVFLVFFFYFSFVLSLDVFFLSSPLLPLLLCGPKRSKKKRKLTKKLLRYLSKKKKLLSFHKWLEHRTRQTTKQTDTKQATFRVFIRFLVFFFCLKQNGRRTWILK